MHDEGAKHAHHFLHGHMRVVEVSTLLVQRELVNEASARLDRHLADAGTTVHVVGNFEAMPVHRGRFGQVIVNDDANTVSLIDLNGRSGSAAVEAPQNQCLIGSDLLLHWLGNQMKHFDAVIHGEWQIRYIRSLHRHVETLVDACFMLLANLPCTARFLVGKQSRKTQRACANREKTAQEITTVAHNVNSLFPKMGREFRVVYARTARLKDE